MSADRYNRQVSLEIRYPVEAVCREVVFGELANDLVGFGLNLTYNTVVLFCN
jgi:hypothetical protein